MTVSVRAGRIYLPELLQNLQKQSGVQITMDTRASASGLELLANFGKKTLADVLDALYGLLSWKYGDWIVRRLGKPGSYTYALIETTLARQKNLAADAIAKKRLEDYIALMSRLATMSVKERDKHRNEVKKALGTQNEEYIGVLMNADTAVWDQFQLFSAFLSPDEQIKLLRGERRFTARLDGLSADARERYVSIYHSCLPNNTMLPDQFTIYAASVSGEQRDLNPVVYLTLGMGSLSFMHTLLLSHCSAEVIREAWLLPGDQKDDPKAQRMVSSELLPEPDPVAGIHHSPSGRDVPIPPPGMFRVRLNQVAQATALPILALLPEFRQSDEYKDVRKSKVQQFLDGFPQTRENFIYKWRHGMLLVVYPAYFFEEENQIPYDMMAIWRRCPDQLMGPKELVAFFPRLTAVQSERLYKIHTEFRNLHSLMPFLDFAKQHSEILTERGYLLEEPGLSELLTMPPFSSNADFRAGSFKAIRLTDTASLSDGTRRRTTTLEGLDKNEKWVEMRIFVMSKEATPRAIPINTTCPAISRFIHCRAQQASAIRHPEP